MVKRDDELSKSFHQLMAERAKTLSRNPHTPEQSGPGRRAFLESGQGVSRQLKEVSLALLVKT